MEKGLTLEQQDLLNDYRDALEDLHVYYGKRAYATGIVVGMIFLASWIISEIQGGIRNE